MVINAIAELGKYEIAKNPDISPLDIWLENSYHPKNYPHLLLIEFAKDSEGNWTFSKVDYREHSDKFKGKLLYKTGSPRGTDKTPTCKVAKSLEGSYQQKIVKWFADNHKSALLTEEQQQFLTKFHNVFTENSEVILEALKQKVPEDKKGVVISCSFKEGEQTKFLQDYSFFSLFIGEECKTDYMYSKTFKQESYAKNEVCSICRQKQGEVYGYFTTLKFYTVDKPCMVTGGFQQKDSWKNYPVCFNCALDIEMGIKAMEQHLDFSFYGLRYYMLPKAIHESGYQDMMEIILDSKKSPKVNDSQRIAITNDEKEVLEDLKDCDNFACLNLLFYDKPQKTVFRILASIEQVLPSRLQLLFKAKCCVDQIFQHETKEGKPLFRFHFGFLRTFLPDNKAFLEVTQKIFSDRAIDYHFVIARFMEHLRTAFVKDEYLWMDTLRSFVALHFLFYLNLFRTKEESTTMDHAFFSSFAIKTGEELEPKTLEFFENFKDFFHRDQHCAIFLTGVLAQLLLDIQMRERKATPFRSRLKGLKMNARDITSLLPEIIEKLEQYKANYYRTLESLISKYFLAAGNSQNWKMSLDEMNYVFVLGMNLSKYFKIKKEKENE